jgi:hypothetical protein
MAQNKEQAGLVNVFWRSGTGPIQSGRRVLTFRFTQVKSSSKLAAILVLAKNSL